MLLATSTKESANFLEQKGEGQFDIAATKFGCFLGNNLTALGLETSEHKLVDIGRQNISLCQMETGIGSDIALMPCPLLLPQNCHGVIAKACGSGTMALLNPVKQNSGSLWLLFFSIPVLHRRRHVVYSNRSSSLSFQLVSNVPFII